MESRNNTSKPHSLFDDKDEDDDLVGQKTAKQDNPLSFFSFGSSAPPPSNSRVSSTPSPKIFLDDEEDDDDFFASPPSSFKKQTKKPTRFTDGPEAVPLPSLPPLEKQAQNGSQSSNGDKKPATGQQKAQNGDLNDKQRIAILEEQLAAANQTISKLKEKQKADTLEIEKALSAVEANLQSQISKANKAVAEKQKLEQDLRISNERYHQLQNQYTQQQLIIEQMNRGGPPIPTTVLSESELDWAYLKERHGIASQMLLQASTEAKQGLDLILKHVPTLNQVTILLKDMERITESRAP